MVTKKKEENIEEDVKIVYPGNIVYEGMDILPGRGVYRVNDKIFSKTIGIVRKKGRVIDVIPLTSAYIPKVGDYVVGEIIDIGTNFWMVDINSPYDAFLSIYESGDFVDKEEDIADIYDVGDLLYARISKVTKSKYISLTMKDPQARKLNKGYVIEVPASKVPRIIGKGGSMIKTIKEKTNTRILVGQNGRIWIFGKNADIAAEVIMYVNENSLQRGLTEKVGELIESKIRE